MLSDVRVVVLENVNSYPFSRSCETVFAEVCNTLLLFEAQEKILL